MDVYEFTFYNRKKVVEYLPVYTSNLYSLTSHSSEIIFVFRTMRVDKNPSILESGYRNRLSGIYSWIQILIASLHRKLCKTSRLKSEHLSNKDLFTWCIVTCSHRKPASLLVKRRERKNVFQVCNMRYVQLYSTLIDKYALTRKSTVIVITSKNCNLNVEPQQTLTKSI